MKRRSLVAKRFARFLSISVIALGQGHKVLHRFGSIGAKQAKNDFFFLFLSVNFNSEIDTMRNLGESSVVVVGEKASVRKIVDAITNVQMYSFLSLKTHSRGFISGGSAFFRGTS